jgi:transposase
MQKRIQMIRKVRVYSEAFKGELVRLFESGKYSVTQLETLYGVTHAVIYRWIYRYSQLNQAGSRIVEMKQSDTDKVKQMEQRIKDLERMLGQKQIKIDFLETMIEVAEEELKIDIKKKSSTPQSKGSGKKGKA